MPLITCPDCQTEISDAAPSCIKCGRPMESEAIGSEVFIPPPSLNLFEATATCFRKYAVFSGRASRSEFWYFYLSQFILGLLTILIDSMMGYIELGPSATIFFLVCSIPYFAVGTRRLHDTNRSGWRFLWAFTIIGAWFILYWLTQKGDDHSNSYN
jgi:uncharacterized membrane protein YhaH (DUF805 family)